jgi:hypothetical protein
MAIGVVLLGLSACSTAEIDKLPKEYGGLPEGAPRRSDNPPPYPAVHDMPPDRAKALLDPDEQKRLEADLVAARNRLQGQQKNQVRQQNQGKDATKPPRAERASARGDRPSVKRGRSQASGAREQPAAAPANPRAGGDAPASAAPPAADGSGFGRNP